MRVFFLSRRRLLLCIFLLLAAVVVAALCLRPSHTAQKTAADNAQRVAYLEELGWQVETEPIETLRMTLPDDLSADYAEYLALQKAQDFPFASYAGQEICRTTYRITNYPGGRADAQVNLLQCGDAVIGGDVVLLGENGGQFPLTYPAT